jgi:hypothetical protein
MHASKHFIRYRATLKTLHGAEPCMEWSVWVAGVIIARRTWHRECARVVGCVLRHTHTHIHMYIHIMHTTHTPCCTTDDTACNHQLTRFACKSTKGTTHSPPLLIPLRLHRSYTVLTAITRAVSVHSVNAQAVSAHSVITHLVVFVLPHRHELVVLIFIALILSHLLRRTVVPCQVNLCSQHSSTYAGESVQSARQHVRRGICCAVSTRGHRTLA